MKVSLNWLKEFLDLTQSPEQIADALTLAGIEVEGVEEVEGDRLFDVSLTPNLGHCMSVIGMVRELSALLELPIKRQEVFVEESDEKVEDLVQVDIEDRLQCTKYCARVVRGVEVGPSPDWLREKLEKAGLRSVNSVVDVGNFVMLELGQPLHLFDLDQLARPRIVVRAAKTDGSMECLDGIKRAIPDGSLLVCDEKRPIAFAGVIGELSSAVSETTRNVLIEAALFTPEAIRKTSKQLNLRTDSAQRFERGVDPLSIEAALDLAASLLQGRAARGIVEAIARPYVPHIVTVSPERVNRLLGIHLSPSEITALLTRLELVAVNETDREIRFQIPSHRNDLKTEIDLIEEVGRLYGFNNIPRKRPRHASSTLSHAPLFLFEEEVRATLVAQGLQEWLTCDLISPKQAALSAEKDPISVLHPASIDQSVLRPSLLPGLLEAVRYNLDRQNRDIAAFEVGHIHLRTEKSFTVKPSAGIILVGNSAPHHFGTKPTPTDFLQLKGHVENLFEAIGLRTLAFTRSHTHPLHPQQQAHFSCSGQTLGILGQIHPRHLRDMGIDQRVYFAEIDLQPLIDLRKGHRDVQAFSLMPGSERDWTLSLEDQTPIGSVVETIQSFDSSLLEQFFLLDLYKSDDIGKNGKNATFRFLYRDPGKTISAEEVEKEHKRLTQHVAEKLGHRVP